LKYLKKTDFVRNVTRFIKVPFTSTSPITAQRCRSATEKNILENLFSSVLSEFKKYYPPGNLKFNYSGIFQSLKLRFFTEKKSFQFLLS